MQRPQVSAQSQRQAQNSMMQPQGAPGFGMNAPFFNPMMTMPGMMPMGMPGMPAMDWTSFFAQQQNQR